MFLQAPFSLGTKNDNNILKNCRSFLMLIYILRTKTLRTYDPAKNLEFEKHEEDLCDLYYYFFIIYFYSPIFGKVRPHFHDIQAQPFFNVRKSGCQLINDRFRQALKRCTEHKRDIHAMHSSKPLRQRREDCLVIENVYKWRPPSL